MIREVKRKDFMEVKEVEEVKEVKERIAGEFGGRG
jgi:hypothetical protein